MAADPARRRATYQDVLDAPEHLIAEIVDGDLSLLPRPAKPHALASTALGEELGPPFRRGRNGPGGWIILDEPELHLGDDVLVPDLAGWRRERLPRLDASVPYFELTPDWVCEVLSPKTRRFDLGEKLPSYAAAGVPWCWLVDPPAQLLQVHQLSDAGKWTIVQTFTGSTPVRVQPFDAIALELGALWDDVDWPEE